MQLKNQKTSYHGCYNPGANQIVNNTCQYYIGKCMKLLKLLFNG